MAASVATRRSDTVRGDGSAVSLRPAVSATNAGRPLLSMSSRVEAVHGRDAPGGTSAANSPLDRAQDTRFRTVSLASSGASGASVADRDRSRPAPSVKLGGAEAALAWVFITVVVLLVAPLPTLNVSSSRLILLQGDAVEASWRPFHDPRAGHRWRDARPKLASARRPTSGSPARTASSSAVVVGDVATASRTEATSSLASWTPNSGEQAGWRATLRRTEGLESVASTTRQATGVIRFRATCARTVSRSSQASRASARGGVDRWWATRSRVRGSRSRASEASRVGEVAW